jgi:hypothetical protein
MSIGVHAREREARRAAAVALAGVRWRAQTAPNAAVQSILSITAVKLAAGTSSRHGRDIRPFSTARRRPIMDAQSKNRRGGFLLSNDNGAEVVAPHLDGLKKTPIRQRVGVFAFTCAIVR